MECVGRCCLCLADGAWQQLRGININKRDEEEEAEAGEESKGILCSILQFNQFQFPPVEYISVLQLQFI